VEINSDIVGSVLQPDPDNGTVIGNEIMAPHLRIGNCLKSFLIGIKTV
jgi:hypothetical protein